MNSITSDQRERLERLINEGKVTPDNFESFLENPYEFFDKNGYPVHIDKKLTFEQRIEAGQYGRRNDLYITPNHFLIEVGTGIVNVKLRLIKPVVSKNKTREIEEHCKALGLPLAGIEHLLAFGAKYPKLQKEFTIMAFGTPWIDPDGTRCFPCLDNDYPCGRTITVTAETAAGWRDHVRVLVIAT